MIYLIIYLVGFPIVYAVLRLTFFSDDSYDFGIYDICTASALTLLWPIVAPFGIVWLLVYGMCRLYDRAIFSARDKISDAIRRGRDKNA